MMVVEGRVKEHVKEDILSKRDKKEESKSGRKKESSEGRECICSK